MNDSEIRTLADRVLRNELGQFGYQRTEVRSGFDHSDEPAIYVDAILGMGAPPLRGNTLIDAHFELSRELLSKGEERFPYLRTKRLDDDLPDDEVLRPLRSHS